MKFTRIFILLSALTFSSCSTHLTDLSMISNKNINLEKVNIDKSPQRKLVEGRDTKFIFLFIPFGQPQIKEALNNALIKGHGDLMVDASLYHESIWFIVGQQSLVIKGTVVDTKGIQ